MAPQHISIPITQMDKDSNPGYPGKCVLVVEDNLINQKVVKGMLKKPNLEVDIANNGKEALEILQQKTFDLVFMDCQMPVMDGYEATKEIRKSTSPYKDITIVAMTANAMTGDREACLAAGMDDYISKPLKPKDLNKCLNFWLKDNMDQLNNKLVS